MDDAYQQLDPTKFQFAYEFMLDKSNWLGWKGRVERACKWKNLLGHLHGTKPRPSPIPPIISLTSPSTFQMSTVLDTAEQWDFNDNLVIGILTMNVKDWEAQGIDEDSLTAAEIWEKLCDKWERKNYLTAIYAKRELEFYKMKAGTTLTDHFIELAKMRKHAIQLGATITDQEFGVIIIQSLPESTAPFTAGCYDEPNPEKIMTRLKLLVQAGAMKLDAISASPNVDTAAAMNAKAELICEWCHWKRHTKANCYCVGGGKAGQQPAHWKNPPKPKRGSPCDKAMATGSSQSQPAQGTSNPVASTPAVPPTTTQANIATTTMFDYDMFQNHAAFMTCEIPPSTDARTAYLDSGATHHYFNSKDAFSQYLPITPRAGSSSKKGAALTIIGVGVVRALVVVDGKQVLLTLRNAIHAPDIAANLISVPKLDEAGYGTHTLGGTMRAYDPKSGRNIIEGSIRTGGLYEVKLLPVPPSLVDKCPTVEINMDPRAFAVPQAASTKGVSLDVWHRHLGHVAESTIQKMASSGVVHGLVITGDKPLGRCEDCIFGKQARAPFEDSEKATDPLELVHTDHMGPMPVISLGGAKYVMTFNDNATSYSAVEFPETKKAEESLKYMRQFQVRGERQTGFRMKRIRSDNGTEYKNELWEEWCAETGIIHEKTTVYTPQQNGVAERGHRTMTESVIAMLRDSRLPMNLWAEAYAFKCYAMNVCSSARQDGLTPFEKWFGTKPNVAHMRPFGTPAYIRVPKETRRKLDERSRKVFLVGYTGNANYRFWDPKTNDIVLSRDVVFEETDSHRTAPAEFPQANAENAMPLFDFVEPPRPAAPVNDAPIIPEPIDAAPIIPDAPADRAADDVVAPHPLPNAPADDHLADKPDDASDIHPDAAEVDEWLAPDFSEDDEPPALPEPELRRSSRNKQPSQAALESKEYEAREQAAREGGEPWAEDATALTVLPPVMPSSNDEYPYRDGFTPTTYKEALTAESVWGPAMKREWDGLNNIESFELVPRTPSMNIVGCKWAYARKFNGQSDWKPKARLVAKGFHQIPGVDFFESHASVVRFESIRAICAIATYRDMEMSQMDIEKAYLNAVPEETIYMQQPPGYIDAEHPDWVLRVRRALYGLMQSGNVWWKHLDKSYQEMGFRRNRADECVRARKNGDELIISAAYTDDLNNAADAKSDIEQFHTDMRSRYRLSAGGEMAYMLGITVERDRENGTLTLCQKAYAERVVARFGMADCNPVATPLEPGCKLVRSKAELTPEDKAAMATISYREALGSIQYLAVATRPDLSFPVHALSQFMSAPSIEHWRALKRLLRYIKGTAHYAITYYRKDHPGSSLQPRVYADAAHADCEKARSSHGHVVVMANGPVSWSSRKQTVVAKSTTEAEYISLCNAGDTALWFGKFLDDLYLPVQRPITMFTDNRGAESLASRSADFRRLRHLRVDYHWLRDAVRDKDLKILSVPGSENPADIFTKSLPSVTLLKHLNFLRVAVQGGC